MLLLFWIRLTKCVHDVGGSIYNMVLVTRILSTFPDDALLSRGATVDGIACVRLPAATLLFFDWMAVLRCLAFERNGRI